MSRWRLLAAITAALAMSLAFYSIYGALEREKALSGAREQAARRASLEIGALTADIAKFRVLPPVLTELPDIHAALVTRSPAAQRRLDASYRTLAAQTGATVLYAVDRNGVARSASNAGTADTFVGHQFLFRPYFRIAMRLGSAEYFAKGSVTGRPGLFLARRAGPSEAPTGVVVIKVEFDRIAKLWQTAGLTSLVVDQDGIVVIGTDPRLLFRVIAPLSAVRPANMRKVPPFGDQVSADTGLSFSRAGFVVDRTGTRYLVTVRPLPVLHWRYVHLEPLRPALAAAEGRVRLATLIVTMIIVAITTLVSWSASRSRRSERARRLLETEVTHRTAELTDAYQRLQREAAERASSDSRYRAAREELAQANRLGWIGTIITSVAHELNQPVAAIRAAADNSIKLLARGRQEPAADNLSLIVSLTQRIGVITAELLSYGRRGHDDRAATSLDQIVDSALMLTNDSFHRERVLLHVDREQPLHFVEVSRVRIEQVLVNLLQNALHAASESNTRRVRLGVSTTAEMARMVVEDSGAGVPIDLRETIFQPFYTGKSNGTGLGLGISREIVRDHGGTLTVDASPLGGAAFVVDLPTVAREDG